MGSVLLTGCDGGLGLGLLKGLLEQPSPPRHLFAACLDPQGKVGRVLGGGGGLQLGDRLRNAAAGAAAVPTWLGGRELSFSIPHCDCHGKKKKKYLRI